MRRGTQFPPFVAPNSCVGDSGGPLVLGGVGGFRAIGITSWGLTYCASGPEVYTKVSQFASFIQTTIGDAGSVGTYNPIAPVRILDTAAGAEQHRFADEHAARSGADGLSRRSRGWAAAPFPSPA